jgi:hypothetical protein
MKLADSIAMKNKANKPPANPASDNGTGLNADGKKDPTIREF